MGDTFMAKKAATKKAAVKTQETAASVSDFIASVEDDVRRADAKALDKMLRDVTGEKPRMWGASIVGYGVYTNKTSSGEAEWPKLSFSPRKGATAIYLVPELLESDPAMKKLGKFKNGKSCLTIGKLEDMDSKVLREISTRSWKHMTTKHG